MRERDWMRGNKYAWMAIVSQALREIGQRNDTMKKAALILERQQTVNALRDLSAVLGCDDWPDDLHLADVVNKYIIPAVDDLPKRRKKKL